MIVYTILVGKHIDKFVYVYAFRDENKAKQYADEHYPGVSKIELIYVED